MSAARARRLLRRPGAWIEATGPGGYGVRTSATRRGRVALALGEAEFLELATSPGLKTRPGGGWLPRSETTPEIDRAGRPGVVEGIATTMQADGRMIARRANLAPSAIDWLAQRKDGAGRPWLTPAEQAAARRLQADAEIALKGPSLTMRWDALPRSGGGSAARVEPGGRAVSASRRVEAALRACGRSRAIVEAICIQASPLQAAEQGLGLRRREGRSLLITGLRALAAHYRIG